jgi:hypothetical protein
MTNEKDEMAIVVATPQAPMVYEDPKVVMKRQKDQAKVLAGIVLENQHLITHVGGKNYLQYELWQTIGAFNGVFPQTEEVSEVWGLDGGGDPAIMAYKAVVGGYREGIKIASAIAYCGMDSFPTRGRSGFDKDRAAMSAAQTWAGSKMFRMIFSVVAVLGGFAATTAEEMQENEQEETPPPATVAPRLPNTGPAKQNGAPEPPKATRGRPLASTKKEAAEEPATFEEQRAKLLPWAAENHGFASERAVLVFLKMDSIESIRDMGQLKAAIALIRIGRGSNPSDEAEAAAPLEGE